jgi:ribosome-associated protein
MANLIVKNGIEIPENELNITTSKSGGAGGQHVNKTETKVTVKWNIIQTKVLNEDQKELALKNLENKLTKEGEIIVQNSETRSREQNKEKALNNLAKIISKALYIPKKRMKTKVPKKEKEKRIQEKKHRSEIKKGRVKIEY